MIALAEAAAQWPEFEVQLCFKLVKGVQPTADLMQAAVKACPRSSFTHSNSLKLMKLIAWADILHVQNTPPDVIFAARLLGKKVFLTVHNWRRPAVNFHYRMWRVSVRMAHHRWFNSRFVWETWEPRKKQPNSECLPTVSKLPTAWCPPEQRKGFLFVGRWIPNKGIQEILRAYALNQFNPTEWPLTILGDGPIREEVRALAQELGLHDVVAMPGFVDATSKEKYLSSCRWLLAPALTKEDLGLTPIEARSVGVPSIVTRDGGLPEAGGPAALVAEPGDVEDLARCMRQASEMQEAEYTQRGKLAHASLQDFLKPIEYYRQAYVAY